MSHPSIGDVTRVTEVTKPTFRVRIAHDNTAKGHRLKETTVEWTGPRMPNSDDWKEIDLVMETAYHFGTGEANERNAAEKEAP